VAPEAVAVNATVVAGQLLLELPEMVAWATPGLIVTVTSSRAAETQPVEVFLACA
jgi:predicted benzoate:H+ symporter BenE